jgi:hypothetical protein
MPIEAKSSSPRCGAAALVILWSNVWRQVIHKKMSDSEDLYPLKRDVVESAGLNDGRREQ